MNGYERLGNAVVMQAVKNWRSSTRKLKRNPDNYEAKRLKKECEKFFLSQCFNMYTNLDGRALLEMLNRPPPIIYIRKDKRMMQIIKILIWLFWLFCCNCLLVFLCVVIGSLIFHYHIHFYVGIIGGAVLSLCELIYVIVKAHCAER